MQQKKRSSIGAALYDEAIPLTGMHKQAFAESVGISRTHLYDIIRGDRRLTWKVAKRLGKITDRSAHEWLALQAEHDLAS